MAERSQFYPGWISEENPSPSPIGFAAVFEGREVYADFHNLPFFYGSRGGYEKYHERIVTHVTRHPTFAEWRGHAHRFKADNLPLLVQLLNDLAEPEAAPDFLAALARVDFSDDSYRLLRVIDGDTLVVEPPPQLRPWLLDIHVRLYGLETPELFEDFGRQYKRHLDDLCQIDGKSQLRIVWERESLRTNYPGFPRGSFQSRLMS